MRAIPYITTSSARITVDDLHYRGPFLGLIGVPVWRVRWRRTDRPCTRGSSVLRPGQTAGCAELAGEPFDFVVRWRRDRRRRIAERPSRPRREQPFVTPASVLQLAEYPARLSAAQSSPEGHVRASEAGVRQGR